MKLSGRQLLVLLELYVDHSGKANDIDAIANENCFSCGTISELAKLKLIKLGPRDVDQAEPVKLTGAGKRIAKAMVDAAEGALT